MLTHFFLGEEYDNLKYLGLRGLVENQNVFVDVQELCSSLILFFP